MSTGAGITLIAAGAISRFALAPGSAAVADGGRRVKRALSEARSRRLRRPGGPGLLVRP
jgi:hypothetical protein